MKTKKIKLSTLKPHPKNPNAHPENQIKELQNSLDQFDQVKNIVTWQGYVIAGCGLLEAAKKQAQDTILSQVVLLAYLPAFLSCAFAGSPLKQTGR